MLKQFFAVAGRFFKRSDIYVILLSIVCTVFGLILVASATKSYNTGKYLIVQSGSALLGVLIFIIISLMDIKSISSAWKTVLVLNLLLIASLFIFGVGGESTGNRSWIRFFGIGLQPAELGKLLFIISLNGHMNDIKDKITTFGALVQLTIHMLLVVGLIVLASSDIGMATVYVFIFFVMLLIAGIRLRWFIFATAGLGASLPIIWNFLLSDRLKTRFMVLLNPALDPLNHGYNALQSKIAIGSGQRFGFGLFNGIRTQHSLLPAKQTDFIFSVAAEELGMLGAMFILGLLVFLILRCMHIATKSDYDTGKLIVVGIAAMLTFQVFFNIGMCIGLLPIVGLTLPFFSYGGTSLVTMFAAVGLVNSVCMHAPTKWATR